eukprot:4008418-Amphidinium_carterae.1
MPSSNDLKSTLHDAEFKNSVSSFSFPPPFLRHVIGTSGRSKMKSLGQQAFSDARKGVPLALR